MKTLMIALLLLIPFAANSECLNDAYWDNEFANSAVEPYTVLATKPAIAYFLTQFDLPAYENTEKVVVIVNTEKRSRIDGLGIIPFEDGCSRDDVYLIPKGMVDNVLSSMLYQDIINLEPQ